MPKTKKIKDRMQAILAIKQLTQASQMAATARLACIRALDAKRQPYSRAFLQLFRQLAFASDAPCRHPALMPHASKPAAEAMSSPDLSNTSIQPVGRANHGDSASAKGEGHSAGHAHPQKVLIVGFSSDKGLCGAYHHHIVGAMLERQRYHVAEGRQVELLPIGNKGKTVLRQLDHPYLQDPGCEKVENQEQLYKLVSLLYDYYVAGQTYDLVEVTYQPARLATRESVVTKPFLPFSAAAFEEDIVGGELLPSTLYEPDRQTIAAAMVEEALRLWMYNIWVRKEVAEHTTRMVLTSKATKNAEDLIKALRMQYNRTRQAAVTQQIAEINAAAHSL